MDIHLNPVATVKNSRLSPKYQPKSDLIQPFWVSDLMKKYWGKQKQNTPWRGSLYAVFVLIVAIIISILTNNVN